MEFIREPRALLKIERDDFTLYIKGVPYDRKYLSLKQYRKHLHYENETMEIGIEGDAGNVAVYNVKTDRLEPYEDHKFPPVFFENGVYQFVLIPEMEEELRFYHEYPAFRKAVSWLGEGKRSILTGQLDFRNEIGYSTFTIRKNGEDVLSVTLEIFPSKLSYKKDFNRLLQEVNDEIYNLAFHFLRKTYAIGSTVTTASQSMTEFFRLVEHYFPEFTRAIKQIESLPHHQLQTTYAFVRADQIRRSDRKSMNFLARKPHWFQEAENGIPVNGKTYLPVKGLNVKKAVTYDNLENRFVKWMMQRMVYKLNDLLLKLTAIQEEDKDVIQRVKDMKTWLEGRLGSPFWQGMSRLDRSVFNLVMQMKPGYREALKIYLILMMGITLQGELLKISLKDVATLYEYWTFLKMGQILRKHYRIEEQSVIKAKYGSLYVYLDESASAKQVFRHPQTGERIMLTYQKRENQLPTVKQIPDIMLEIEKKGVPYTYNYLFDAKYRIDFQHREDGTMIPGPMEEDINTMHRYRDALVVKNGGPYERHAFGAYVLFPWDDEDNYEMHPFYKSIDEVNIGGLPFLPNAVKLVERFIERLVNSNPEDLQEEGILPRGSVSYWKSKLEEKVLVVSINDVDQYRAIKRTLQLEFPAEKLTKGWDQAAYMALYVTKHVSSISGVENGIRFYSEITDVKIVTKEDGAYARFQLKPWKMLPNLIRPVGYVIQNMMITTINLLKEAEELPELFMKTGEEKKLWRMLRRFTSRVKTELDAELLDEASKIESYQIGKYTLALDTKNDELVVSREGAKTATVPLWQLRKEPAKVFKQLKQMVYGEQ